MKTARVGAQRAITERTFSFALHIVQVCRELDETPGVGRTLAQQLLRSGTSIGANVEEAQAGQSRADFISKNAITLKEAREASYWLKLIREAGLVRSDRLDTLIAEAEELSKILGSIVARSKQRPTS